MIVVSPSIVILQLLPERGRLLVCKDDVLKIDSITTYPRKGTEPVLLQHSHSSLRYYNLSPQGDGNRTVRIFSEVPVHYNLSPQGDGNFCLLVFNGIYFNYNLSPQGDVNRITKISMLFFNIATYPRKGTESQGLLECSEESYCNLSPLGDKTAPLPLAFASSGGALLFPIFYFTGWELRLPESSL